MMRAPLFAALLALSACATSHEDAPPGPPSLAVSANVTAPAQATLYADCVAQSAAEHTYFREARDDTLLRFNCVGDAARRFFDGLGPYSARVGSEMIVEQRTWRFTAPIQRDTVGLDYCWRDSPNANAEPAYACTIVLNVGDFLKN